MEAPAAARPAPLELPPSAAGGDGDGGGSPRPKLLRASSSLPTVPPSWKGPLSLSEPATVGGLLASSRQLDALHSDLSGLDTVQQVVHARQLTEQTIHALELQLETERMKRRTLLNVEATLKSAAETEQEPAAPLPARLPAEKFLETTPALVLAAPGDVRSKSSKN